MKRYFYLLALSSLTISGITAQPHPYPAISQRKNGPLGKIPGAVIPYPEAIAKADVHLSDISNISTNGIILGNGELNAILYSTGEGLRLRLSKNDCWDMRINTSKDASLPVIDVSTGRFSAVESSNSWDEHSYPTALPCADVLLVSPVQKSLVLQADLNLLTANARVKSTYDTATFRVLNQQNVVLIESLRRISFTGINKLVEEHNGNRQAKSGKSIAGWVSDAEIGADSSISYLHQHIPGDQDAKDMDIYVVAASRGASQAIAVVTSRESDNPLHQAKAMALSAVSDVSLVAKHEEAWLNFWSKSGVELSDENIQNWWYRMLYFNRCFAKEGGNAIGLQAAFDQLGGWHNSLKLNYNIQQTYLSGAPTNHIELIEPFISVLSRNLKRAKWFAQKSFLSQGAFFHSDIWPFETDPAQSKTKNQHQLAYLPWGYSWGMAGHAAAVLWEYYTYQPTQANLNKIYPILREFALFYCSVLEKCQLKDSKRVIGPSFFPENGSFGQYNVSYDITFINLCLKAGRDATALKGDKSLNKRITSLLAQMPAYTTVYDPVQKATIVEEWSGAGLQKKDGHGTLAQAVFPGDQVNWFSDTATVSLYKRTINWIETVTGHVNSNVTINIARARLGMGDEALENAHMLFDSNSKHSNQQPNGLFYWPLHGYFVTEQVGIARLVTEFLLQSNGEAIRLFPAWPIDKDASFSNLRVKGGATISASLKDGTVEGVSIHAEFKNKIRLVNPWPLKEVIISDSKTNAKVSYSQENGCVTFQTRPGIEYSIAPR